MASLSFTYGKCLSTTSNGYTRGYTGSGHSSKEWFDPYAKMDIVGANGIQILVNGINANRKFPYGANTSSFKVTDLVMRAPYDTLLPAFSLPGDGNIFGNGYIWRFRGKNSVTNEVSGLSTSVTPGVNLGLELVPGSGDWVGQTAYIYIPNSSIPAFADVVQVFRNINQNTDEYYLIGELAVTGSTLTFIDDFADEDIIFNEQASLSPNPTYQEGLPFPCTKAFRHSTGRIMLYGVQRMGPTRPITFGTHVVGTDTITLDGAMPLDPSREGQSLRLLTTSGGADIGDRTIYRILEVVDYQTIRIYPVLQANSSGSYTNINVEITDDRDARTIFVSEPGNSTQYDFLKIMSVGFDQNDGLLHLCQMEGVTYAITRRRIYRVENDQSEDPSLTYRLTVVAEEGTIGFWSTAVAPFGIVMVNDKGVRVFDGTICKPLGSRSPFDRFLLKQQFTDPGNTNITYAAYVSGYQGPELSLLDQVCVYYDPTRHYIRVFYVPYGNTSFSEEIVFSALHNVWRGPWRCRGTHAGLMRNDDGSDVFVIGEDFGNLILDEQGSIDVLNGSNISLVTFAANTKWELSYLGGNSDYYSDKRIRGTPILFVDPNTTNTQMNWIVDTLTATSIVVEKLSNVVSGFSSFLGAIYWYTKTGWIDDKEPIQPKTLETLRLRLEPLTPLSDNNTFSFLIKVNGDDNNTITQPDNPPTYTTLGDPWFEAVMHRGNCRVFQIIMEGYTTRGNPKLTNVVADLLVQEGNPAT